VKKKPTTKAVARFLKIGSTLFALLFYCSVVIFRTPFFKEKQYKLSNNNYEKVKVATSSAETSGQTIAEKAEEILGKEANNINLDAFEKWSVLENFSAGYRLVYPAGFKINYDYGKVEITPPSGPGKIIVYIKDKTFKLTTILDDADNKQANLLKAASQLVEESFEFIGSPSYNPEEIKERFGD
jgi:hypothetical protein